ncbi:trans-homoaconitate synthase [Brevibacillus laterosporus]|nr:trans-homoaconitate synthase [Brevibacillus laterosporus]
MLKINSIVLRVIVRMIESDEATLLIQKVVKQWTKISITGKWSKKKHMLENFGITLIEIGHPGISPEEECICKTVAETAEQAEILMHARADIEEVRAAFRAKAHWVGIWEPRECARIVQLAVQ